MRRKHYAPILALLLAAGLPAAAEEIQLKDGTKIVGHMTALQGDRIEVETAYGKMQLKRADILSINFPENGAPAASTSASAPAAQPAKPAVQVVESINGTQYVNKTNQFTLALPVGWKIDQKLTRVAPIVTVLTSPDGMRFLTVTQEEFAGSMESYKGMLELTYRRTFGSYEEITQSNVKIDGKPALVFSFRGISAKSDNLPLQFLVAVVPTGTTYTRIATWCAEPLFHETQPAFENIVTSYHNSATPITAQLSKQ
jgi:hypothetical protein